MVGLNLIGKRRDCCGEFGQYGNWTACLSEVGGRSPFGALIVGKQEMTGSLPTRRSNDQHGKFELRPLPEFKE